MRKSLFAVLVIALSSATFAQETSAKPASQAETQSTTQPTTQPTKLVGASAMTAGLDVLKLPVADLVILAKPLTAEELAKELAEWQRLLQIRVSDISKATILSNSATGEAKTKLIEAIAIMSDEQTAITDRMRAIMAAVEAKGGKTEAQQKYIDAVSGINVKPTDVSAVWTFVLHWLQSENGGLRYGANIVLFIVTLIVFRIVTGIVGSVTYRTMAAMKQVSNLLRDFVVHTARKVTMFVGFVIALSMLEVNIGPFLAAMGAAGFVIGFALQGTLSNFAAGIMILLYRPYDLQDTVTVAGVTGKVKAMTLVSTEVTSADGHAVVIPNSSIWGGTITNLGTKK